MITTNNSKDPKETSMPDFGPPLKPASKIKYLEWRIKFLEKKKKCLRLAMKNSIDLGSAQKLVEQDEVLKDAKKQEIKEKLVEQPEGEDSLDSTITDASALPPLTARCRPYPEGCDSVEYMEWVQEYKRVQELNAAYDNLPTQSIGHKDPASVDAVVAADDKRKLQRVADAVVNVSFPCYDSKEYAHLDDLNEYCSGIIISWDKANNRASILTCDCFDYAEADTKRKLYVRWQYMEDTVFEAELLFFSTHYQIALLEVAFLEMPVDIPLEIVPSFGSSPKYGEEVFALARDKELSLMVRHGTILWHQECLFELRQGHLFVDYELPECGTGGPVVDRNGDVVGMSFSYEKGISTILSISTALACVDIWTKFGRVARPLLGMCFRNLEVPEEPCGDDIRFDGFIIDEVDRDSTAWKLGIRSGDVIVSFDGQCPTPLPEFEDFLLNCGSEHLHGTNTEVDFKLEVQDATGVKRSISLRVPFSDVALSAVAKV